MILSVTGHRPPKLCGYSTKCRDKLFEFAVEILDNMEPELVYTGMALGWDQAIADACRWNGIAYKAVIPFKGFESRWPDFSKEIYYRLLEDSDEVIYIHDTFEYDPEFMIDRNIYMVDHSKLLLALYNGDKEGGTYNTFKYALSTGIEIKNVWSAWLDWDKNRKLHR